VLNLDFLIMT